MESLKLYRELLAECLLIPAKPSMELIFSPALSLFPHILADVDVFLAFETSWENTKNSFTRQQRADPKFVRDKFIASILKMWPAFCSHNPLLSSTPSIGPAGGRSHVNVGENVETKSIAAKGETRMQLLMRLATRDSAKFFSPAPEEHAVFAPFSIQEIACIPKPKAASIWGALESNSATAAMSIVGKTPARKKGELDVEEAKASERKRKDSEHLYDSDRER